MVTNVLEGKLNLDFNLGKVISQLRMVPSCELSTLDTASHPSSTANILIKGYSEQIDSCLPGTLERDRLRPVFTIVECFLFAVIVTN